MYNFFPTIETRSQHSTFVNILVPIIAVFLTLITGAIIFYIMVFDPVSVVNANLFLSSIVTSC